MSAGFARASIIPAVKAYKANSLIQGKLLKDNSNTFPIQSERMYQAVRGHGGAVRLVTLPLEAQGYAGRETIEHVLYEMIDWFDKYVKNAPARAPKQTAVN